MRLKIQEKEMAERESWANRIESFLAVLGYIVGLGNIWRFPYMAFKNGGGAFLIPYGICAVLIGFPMFFLETALGQFMKQGGIGSWNIAPIMKGVGIACVLISVYCNIYYIVVLAWGILYFAITISHGNLPWTNCDNWWNSDNCMSYNGERPLLNDSMFNDNTTGMVFNNSYGNMSTMLDTSYGNSSIILNETQKPTLAAVEFWNDFVIRKSSGFEELGDLGNWPLMLCYVGGWILCYFCTFKGVKSTGKVIYFTATFPYFILLVLLIRGCTLPGAVDGIIYYLKPNVSRLADPQVWVDAGSQIIYSYGICFSTLITFASYNDFHYDCYRHTIKLVTACSLTSFVNGFAIFTVIGNLAYVQNITVTDLTLSGPGLVFIAFPTALSLMPLPNLWNALFFFMIILIGIDSQFCGMEVVTTVIVDAWPHKFVKKYRRELLSLVLTLVYIIIGIPFMLNSGIYIFELFNNFAVGGITMLWLALVEAVAIGWVYGMDRFVADIQLMIGYKVPYFFNICIKFISPFLALAICLYYVATYTTPEIDGYKFPAGAEAVGWMLTMSTSICVPTFAIYKLWTAKAESLLEKFKETRRPIYRKHVIEARAKLEKEGLSNNSSEMDEFIQKDHWNGKANGNGAIHNSDESAYVESIAPGKIFPVQCLTDSNETV